MNLALFDIDHTLIPLDSDHSFGNYLLQLGVLDAQAYRQANDRFYGDYQKGCLDIHAWCAFQIGHFAKHPLQQVYAWRDTFFAQQVAPHINEAARSLVAWHQQRGDLCLAVTATNDIVTQPIARAFGIDTLLATQVEIVDEQITGKVVGEPCFRQQKPLTVQAWLARNRYVLERDTAAQAERTENMSNQAAVRVLERVYAYSDSLNDIPLLSFATHPVATNPDDKLLAHAHAHDWPVILLYPDVPR